MRNSIWSRKSRYFSLVTMSAAPYLPPAAAGSSVIKHVPPSTGSSTIFHLMGSDDAKRGPSQYVHFSSSVLRVPSMTRSAPRAGLVPTPTFLLDAFCVEVQDVRAIAAANRTSVISFILGSFGLNRRHQYRSRQFVQRIVTVIQRLPSKPRS